MVHSWPVLALRVADTVEVQECLRVMTLRLYRNPLTRSMFAAAVCLVVLPPSLLGQTTQAWPEIDAYVKVNPKTRLFITAQLTREEKKSSESDLGVHLDLFRKPIRPSLLVTRSLDRSKIHVFFFRVGYHFIRPLESGDIEHRIVTQGTAKHPIRFGITLADRNQTDLRFTKDGFSWRYRNRLSLERTFKIWRISLDSYVRAELWYDRRYRKWSRTVLDVGAEFPINQRMSVESYFELQNNYSAPPNSQLNGVGLVYILYF